MNLSRPRPAIISFILILLITSLACATLLGPGTEVVVPENTSVPVLEESTPVPQAETSEADNQDPTTLPETEPTTDSQSEITPPGDIDTLFAPFWEVWQIVDEEFVDQPVDHDAMLEGAADMVAGASELSDLEPGLDAARSFATAADTPGDLVEASLPFWQTWIRSTAPKDETLMREAIHGMLASLGDQHTSYMDPDQYRNENTILEGDYEGIGAWVDADAEYLTIISPMPGSPAEAAGLEPGDQVIKVDGEDMTGIDGNLVIRRVIGPAGSEVTLTIRREGVEDFDVTITRAKIIIPSITGEMLEDSQIAYVQLFTFGQDTDADLRDVLNDLLAQNPIGLILDLRNNGGGFLTTAIEITSEFIGDGVLMYEVYGDGKRDTYDAQGDGLATEIPMVVLINEGSASASEILAGAIQDYERAPLVGMTSFGKGSVQNWVPLTSEDGAVRVTIARWYTPKERLIQDIGLTPDIVVEITEADAQLNLDPQLDKAIEILVKNE